ncbi:MAG: DUF4142 domain-containing protein [Myroides sp.]
MKNLILAVALVLVTATTFAQKKETLKTQTSQKTNTSKDQTTGQHGTEADRQFVMKALEGGNAEIKKGGLARSKSKNPDIVKYGDMMENDHHSVNGKLKQAAKERGYKVSEQLTAEAQKMYDNLSKMEGEAFDREFLTQMIADHREAIELFKQQAANGTDQELKKLASDALPTLEMHLKEIERLQSTMNDRK